MAGQHADINDSLRIYNLPDEKDSGVRMIVTVDCYLHADGARLRHHPAGHDGVRGGRHRDGRHGVDGLRVLRERRHRAAVRAKPVYEICTLIADKLGLKDQFTEARASSIG